MISGLKFLQNFNLNSFKSSMKIFPAPKILSKCISIIPVGPAPKITKSSPFWNPILLIALIQHANGSINDACSKLTFFGNFNSHIT